MEYKRKIIFINKKRPYIVSFKKNNIINNKKKFKYWNTSRGLLFPLNIQEVEEILQKRDPFKKLQLKSWGVRKQNLEESFFEYRLDKKLKVPKKYCKIVPLGRHPTSLPPKDITKVYDEIVLVWMEQTE